MNKHLGVRACLVLASCWPAPVVVGAEIIEQILVKVNGEIFTKTDLETAPGCGAPPARQQIDPRRTERRTAAPGLSR